MPLTVSRKLVCTFLDDSGEAFKLSYNYVSDELAAATVNALMSGITTNGSIFARTPVSKKGAKIVFTTEDEIAIN